MISDTAPNVWTWLQADVTEASSDICFQAFEPSIGTLRII